jgi:hypothetical protein
MFAVFKRKKAPAANYAIAIKLSDKKALLLTYNPESEIHAPTGSTFFTGADAPELAEAAAKNYNHEENDEQADDDPGRPAPAGNARK